MKFTAVVTCHDDSSQRIIENLKTQTVPPDEILLFISAQKKAIALSQYDGVRIFLQPNFNDWGHAKRAMGMALASGEFLGFFNHDDEYEPDYLERMLEAVEDADVAYCKWTWGQKNPSSVGHVEFRSGSSTSGNWIGRTSLLRRAGYTDRDYSADGTLINAVYALTRRIVKVDAVLYHHNI